MAEDAFSFKALCELESGLAELEVAARAAHDDGSGNFYCSNFIWLPLYTRMRDLLGAYRRPGPGQEATGPLYDADQFEAAYLYLSKLLPPCRDCGCSTFEPVREEQLRSREGLRPS